MGIVESNHTEHRCLNCNRLVEKSCFFLLEIDECRKKINKEIQDQLLKDKQDEQVG